MQQRLKGIENRRITLAVQFLTILLATIPLVHADASVETQTDNSVDAKSVDSFFSDVELHAFLSQGFIKTTSNNYLGYSELGTFDFTETGINLTKKLGDNMQTGLQLFTERIGPSGNFNVGLDWFYFDYHASDLIGIRFGRVKLPFGLYNDTRDIDMARVPILLPQSIYPEATQNFLLAADGAQLYGYAELGSGGGLDYRVYGGTIPIDTSTTPAVTSLNVPYLVGGRLMWDTPVEGLRAGMSAQALRLDYSETVGALQQSGEIAATLWVASAEYTKGNLLLASEFAKTVATSGDNNNSSIIAASTTGTDAGYVMGAYRLNHWLEPALYYSILLPNAQMVSGAANHQHDISGTLRIDINPHWLVKVEGHYMLGTAGLTSSLNGGTPLSELDERWAAFLLKTTAYF